MASIRNRNILNGIMSPSTDIIDYYINDYKISIVGGLSSSDIILISLISINGVKMYDQLVKNGYHISDELKEQLEPIMTNLRRSELIKNIMNNG